MRNLVLLLPILVVLLCASPATAQVTNLMVNGMSSPFTMVSGDTIKWEYNVPTGTTTTGEIWYDVNSNAVIEPGTDVPYFAFTQTDGLLTSDGGPPDLDGVANGHVYFEQPVGIAAGAYIFRFSNNGTGAERAGTCQPLSTVAHSISGTVIPPSGRSAQYIFVELSRDVDSGLNFWGAVTDVSGNFTIQMNGDTAGNPWELSLSTSVAPNVVVPAETTVFVTGDHSGYTFTCLTAVAQVAGRVVDEDGLPVIDRSVYIADSIDGFRWDQTDLSGEFLIGVLADELQKARRVELSTHGYQTTTEMRMRKWFDGLSVGESLFVPLKIYRTNSSIKGVVQIDGVPAWFPMFLIASSGDTVEASVSSEAGTGIFNIPVSDHMPTYNIFIANIPPNLNQTQLTASPGDSGLVMSLTTTGVSDDAGTVPASFALHQNYPNPFNPTTVLSFEIMRSSFVTLRVYDALGREVAVVVNQAMQPGRYDLPFDGSMLGSGVYYYRLSAAGRTEARTMLLVK